MFLLKNIFLIQNICLDPYDPPSSMNIVAISSTSIKVTSGPILANQNGVIIKYTAFYAKVDYDGTTIIGDWEKTTSLGSGDIYLTSLKFYTHYAIKIAGETVMGAGPNTTYQIGRTLEDCKNILFFLKDLRCLKVIFELINKFKYLSFVGIL